MPDRTGPRFPLGQLVATPGALAALTPADIHAALTRHAAGDWGEVDEDDRRENDLSVARGFRLLSAYRSGSGTRFWVLTEADRSVTTLLLPQEY